jgi:hypothetical protein
MKKARVEKYIEPAEDSVALRITNALIATVCIAVACIYASLPSFQTFLYIWFAITGCYTSYYFRHGKHLWLTWSIICGLLFVVFLFARDLLQEFNIGHLENFAPFLSVIAGMQTVHTFDLQTRSDINVSTVLSLLLFTMTAVIARDLLFGFFVMALVVLGSALLYFEAVARTKANQGITQLSQTEISSPFPTQSRRIASGSAILPIASLPVLTVILFACLPRVDSLVDVLFARFHSSPIKVDSKGFNFMSGTGNGPGHGNSGSGRNEHTAKTEKSENKEQNKSTDDANQKNTSISGGTRHPSDTPKTESTAAAAKDGKNGKTAEGSKDGKDGGARVSGKTAASDKLPKDSKSGSGGESKGDADKPDSQHQGDQAGGGTGKGRAHGDVLQKAGAGNVSEVPKDNAAKQALLQKNDLTESDELVFRNKDTAEFDDNVFMTIRSEQPVYLKRTVFDQYDGKHWLATIKTKPAICEKSESGWTELGGVPQLFVASEQKTITVLQVITAEIGLGQIIPAASIPQRVDLREKNSGSVSVDEYGVLRSEKSIKAGTVFKIESKVPLFDIKKMHEAERDAVKEKEILDKQGIYLQLPSALPAEIKKLTEEIVIADDNFFNRADRICKHLRTHYKYSSDVYRGAENEDLVSNFLFKKKEGACGEFSSAFVVMCRLAGVPARCVAGYGPGSDDGRTGRREVCGQDGHAWGEVCIPNVGWVPFDATPTGTMPESIKQDDNWFSALKRNFDQAEATFQSAQQERNIGKGSEEDYKVDQQKVKSSEKQKSSNDSQNTPAQPSQKTPKPPEKGQQSIKKKSQNDETLTPLGRSSVMTESEVLKPAENNPKEKVEDKSFVLSWQAIALALTLIPGSFFIVRLVLLRLRRRAQDNRTMQGVTPSTALYLKMTEDLKRLKVLRRPSDTTDELTRRFAEVVESDERIHPDLEELFKQFIDIYSQERFSEQGHNTENYKQLREIGNRIHSLSKTRLEKQRN